MYERIIEQIISLSGMGIAPLKPRLPGSNGAFDKKPRKPKQLNREAAEKIEDILDLIEKHVTT